MVGFVNFHGHKTSQLDAPKGPCPGVEYRTRFSVLAFFFDVEAVTYCVDSNGYEVDCVKSCPQPILDLDDIELIFQLILLICICVKLKPTWVRINGNKMLLNQHNFVQSQPLNQTLQQPICTYWNFNL